MESYTLKKDCNFKDLEKSYSTIIENPAVRLRVPNSLKEKGVFGIEGLVLLLLATWLRGSSSEKVVHTFCRGEGDFESLCSSLYGICALRLSDSIWLENKERMEMEVALKSAYGKIRKVISGDFSASFKGAYLAIPSIKTPGKNSEYNNPFYNAGVLVGKDKFKDITERAINAVIPQSGRRAQLDQSSVENVSEIIRELFANTHRHARTDAIGNVLQKNIRAVIFNSMDISKSRLVQLIKSGGKEISNFGAEWMPDSGGTLSVLDVTVVDFGPGYAKNWAGVGGADSIAFEDEASAVVDCFRKHKTKASNDSSGSGLTNVLSDLRKLKGWFRLRTGSVLVERSYFFDEDLSLDISRKDIQRKDTHVEGVCFNIVLPLRTARGES